jgi:hypothetical protein
MDIEDASSSDDETLSSNSSYRMKFDTREMKRTSIEPIQEEDESNFKPTPAQTSEKVKTLLYQQQNR